jgi:hypothetical protein
LLDDVERLREKICDDLNTDDEDEFDSDLEIKVRNPFKYRVRSDNIPHMR